MLFRCSSHTANAAAAAAGAAAATAAALVLVVVVDLVAVQTYIYRIHITQVGMRSVEDVERNLAQIQEKVPASLWLEAQGQGLLRPELQFQ